MLLKYCVILFILSSLIGCNTTSTVYHQPKLPLFYDHNFEFVDLSELNTDVYYLTSPQKKWLDSLIKPSSNKSLTRQLIKQLFQKDYLGFSYDNSFTRSASETLKSKTGNCLSMVILSVAIAKHFNLDYKIFDLKTVPVWDKSGGLLLVNGHVNVQLENEASEKNHYQILREKYITLDFLPEESRRMISKKEINQNQLSAIYFTNLAADAMVNQQWDKAYWLIKKSINYAPNYNVAWNSLAVVYRNKGFELQAENAYKHALSIDPNDSNVIANYAILLTNQGRDKELVSYKKKIEKAKLRNPYRFYDEAQTEYANDNFKSAIKLYRKAIKISPFVDQFHFGLFQSYLAIDEMRLAVKSLAQARTYSARIMDRNRYNRKLSMLAGR